MDLLARRCRIPVFVELSSRIVRPVMRSALPAVPNTHGSVSRARSRRFCKALRRTRPSTPPYHVSFAASGGNAQQWVRFFEPI